MKRVMAIRAASICRDVIQPHSIAFRRVFAERDGRTAPGFAPHAPALLLAELDLLGHQHSSVIPCSPAFPTMVRQPRLPALPQHGSGRLTGSFHAGCVGGISGGMIGPPVRAGRDSAGAACTGAAGSPKPCLLTGAGRSLRSPPGRSPPGRSPSRRGRRSRSRSRAPGPRSLRRGSPSCARRTLAALQNFTLVQPGSLRRSRHKWCALR